MDDDWMCVDSLAELSSVTERCKQANRQLLKQAAIKMAIEAGSPELDVDQITHAAIAIYHKATVAADEAVDAKAAQIERRLLNASQH